MTYDLIISVVLYHNSKTEIQNLLKGLEGSSLNYHMVLVDNAPGKTDYNFDTLPKGVSYLPSSKNLGYGRGHNLVIRSSQWQGTYHLIANADIEFDAQKLQAIFRKMESNKEIGLLMPKIIYPSGEDQGLRKLLPKPSDLILRRFLPGFLKGLFQVSADRYELKQLDPNIPMRVPVLSGCFMFCRSSILNTCEGFDPRFFLYLEDVDLSRRMYKYGLNLYWPEVSIIHHYQKGSYRNWRALKLHLGSALKYFNKHGWLFDAERAPINREALKQKQESLI